MCDPARPTDLGVEVIGGRDRLLGGFPLMWAPDGAGSHGGWVINDGAAVRVEERLSCHKEEHKWVFSGRGREDRQAVTGTVPPVCGLTRTLPGGIPEASSINT